MNFALPGLMNPGAPESDRVPPIKKFLPYTIGTVWEGASIGPIMFYGATPSDPATAARIRFFDDDLTIIQELTSSADEVTITDAVLWTFVIDRIVLSADITAGLINWEFVVTAGGEDDIVYAGVMVVKDAPESP